MNPETTPEELETIIKIGFAQTPSAMVALLRAHTNAKMRPALQALEHIGAYQGEGGPNTPWREIVRDLGQTARNAITEISK